MTRAELTEAVDALIDMHHDRRLSRPGLTDAIVILADSYAAGDDPDVQAARRAVLGKKRPRTATAEMWVNPRVAPPRPSAPTRPGEPPADYDG